MSCARARAHTHTHTHVTTTWYLVWDKMSPKGKGDGGSTAQKRRAASLRDIVRVRKHSSTLIASDTTTDKGAPYKSTKTSNRNLTQDEQTDDVCTTTSYFDPHNVYVVLQGCMTGAEQD